jgi:hypothetical protein
MMTMDWQEALHEAVHEPDPQIMDEKIRAAETAILAHFQISLPAPTHSKSKHCSTRWGPLGYCEALAS